MNNNDKMLNLIEQLLKDSRFEQVAIRCDNENMQLIITKNINNFYDQLSIFYHKIDDSFKTPSTRIEKEDLESTLKKLNIYEEVYNEINWRLEEKLLLEV